MVLRRIRLLASASLCCDALTAGISAALRDLVRRSCFWLYVLDTTNNFQYAAEVIRFLVKVSVKLLSGPGGNPFLRL
jgi:hypothetical protein